MTLALSVRQPYAWAILHAGKDVENRDWKPHNPGRRVRGRILLHAGKAFYSGKQDAAYDIRGWAFAAGIEPPHIDDLPLGGIVGEVEIVDCVTEYDSPWFNGPVGLVLRNPKPLPFRPYKGELGFFKVEE